MGFDEDWDALFNDHPVLSLPKSVSGPAGKGEAALHLSLSSLPDFVDADPVDDKPTPSGRRQAVAVKDADLIFAVGSEIRIMPLGDSKTARSTSQKAYKTLHTPNIQFEIHQIALNPNGKLLAVAGAFQVAVVVLPRTGLNKLVTTTVDCKSIQVGQYYHAADSAVPVAKVDWHPWGQGGSTLMVMTTDGKLREYDISVDADEPQQVLSFVVERLSRVAYAGEGREVASFTLGKGRADWGPLTIYALMKEGDIIAMCPYMPQNASIPSNYLHALECYVSAKQEFLSRSLSSSTDGVGRTNTEELSLLYSYQHKYVKALLKQLPPGTTWPGATRLVPMHPPPTFKSSRTRQGPFLLQPSPRNLDGSEGGDTTDIIYMSFGDDTAEDTEEETERLGLLLLAHQDGKIDVFCDVEKIEARWDLGQGTDKELPMLATYESIDLGIVSTLAKASNSDSTPLLDLIQGNHPVFHPDPIYNDTVYIYHAFGVHALYLGPVVKSLAAILHEDDDHKTENGDAERALMRATKKAQVQPVLLTFSVEQKCSTPVVGITVPNDVYLTYSIFTLTSSMRMSVFPLNLRSEASYTAEEEPQQQPEKPLNALSLPTLSMLSTSVADPAAIKVLPAPEPAPPPEEEEPPAYVSLLAASPWKIPDAISVRPNGLPSNPRLSLPQLPTGSGGKEIALTPDTLRYFGTTVERLSAQIDEAQIAQRGTEARAALQGQEFQRQRETCSRMLESMHELRGPRLQEVRERLAKAQEEQRALLARTERVLQGFMTRASPAVSESEGSWFEELGRMKVDIVGAGKYDDRSLAAKIKSLRREVDRLLPHMQEMKEKETARRKSLEDRRESLGLSQAFELGKRSTEERTKMDTLESEILSLARKLDITLGHPPSRQQQEPEQKTDASEANGN